VNTAIDLDGPDLVPLLRKLKKLLAALHIFIPPGSASSIPIGGEPPGRTRWGIIIQYSGAAQRVATELLALGVPGQDPLGAVLQGDPGRCAAVRVIIEAISELRGGFDAFRCKDIWDHQHPSSVLREVRRQLSGATIQLREAVRPEKPTRTYCLQSRNRIRWIGPPKQVAPRLWQLLGHVLDAGGRPLGISVMEDGKQLKTSSIRNDISALNGHLLDIGIRDWSLGLAGNEIIRKMN